MHEYLEDTTLSKEECVDVIDVWKNEAQRLNLLTIE